jgi:hypothetical protein
MYTILIINADNVIFEVIYTGKTELPVKGRCIISFSSLVVTVVLFLHPK